MRRLFGSLSRVCVQTPKKKSAQSPDKETTRRNIENGAEGARTPDLNAASVALSQLSYSPEFSKQGNKLQHGAMKVNGFAGALADANARESPGRYAAYCSENRVLLCNNFCQCLFGSYARRRKQASTKASKSAGPRLDIRFPSSTTSLSSNRAPAFLMSCTIDRHPVTRRPDSWSAVISN